MQELQDNYTISSKNEIRFITNSKGNQKKWRTDNGIWLKADNTGYEGLAEEACTNILKSTNVENYVTYKTCKIYQKDMDVTYIGCASEEFLHNSESIITLEKLLTLNGYNPDDIFETGTTEDRLFNCINIITKLTGIQEFGNWLGLIIELDAFTLNEDRHINNIAFILENNKYKLTPVFDNGAALLSDTKISYPMYLDTQKATDAVTSKPFSKGYRNQLTAVKNVCGLKLKFNSFPKKLEHDNKSLYNEAMIDRINRVIDIQILKYYQLFNA